MKQQQLLELYDNYSDNAFRLAMSFLGNIVDSEDIVQNVYTKLIEKNPHISKGCEKSYILTHDRKYVQKPFEISGKQTEQQL